MKLTDIWKASTMTRLCTQLLVSCVVTVVGLAVAPQSAFAQYMGKNFHGDFGVNSGTQAGPGLYVAIPFAQWNADNIKDADGNKLAASTFQGLDIRAMFPTLIGVTPKRYWAPTTGSWWRCPSRPSTPNARYPNLLSRTGGSTTCISYRCISDGIHRVRISSRGMDSMRRPDGTRPAPTTTLDSACGRTRFKVAPRFTSMRQRSSAPLRPGTSRCTRTRRTRI